MRPLRLTSVLAGAAALALATSSAAWACSDKDAGLKLSGKCSGGSATWTVSNPNTYQIPFSWIDSLGGKSNGLLEAPAQGSIVLATHAPSVTVVADRPDRGGSGRHYWQGHGDTGRLHCSGPSPHPSKSTATSTPTPTKSTPTPTTTKKTATATPSTATPTPTTTTPATPAQAVTRTPTFTG